VAARLSEEGGRGLRSRAQRCARDRLSGDVDACAGSHKFHPYPLGELRQANTLLDELTVLADEKGVFFGKREECGIKVPYWP
jgi:hypothetical protein